MAAELFFLTESDRSVLREMIDRFRRLRNTPSRSQLEEETSQSPEIYIAKVPSGGIEAATEPGTGSGTSWPDYPQQAECSVYRINTVNPQLEPITGLTRTVYNIHPTSISGDTWVVTARDKFGSWIVVNPGGGGGGSLVIEEEDGSPLSAPNTLQFPNSSLEDDGGGVYSVRLADESHAGMVSLADQVLGNGVKSFQDNTKYLTDSTGVNGIYSEQETDNPSGTQVLHTNSLYQSNTLKSFFSHSHASGGSGYSHIILSNQEHGGYFQVAVGTTTDLTLYNGGSSTAGFSMTGDTVVSLGALIIGVGSAFIYVQDPNSLISLDGNAGASATTGGLTFYGGIYTGGTLSVSVGNISGFDEAVDDRVAALLVEGTGITLTYDDGANTLTIDASGSGYTDENAQDAVGNILTDTDTINFTYNDGTPSIIADVRYQMSITADSSGIKLSGDSDTPGNSKYYGTDSGGSRGFYDLPTGTGDVTAASAFAVDNVLIRSDGTGKGVQASSATLADSGALGVTVADAVTNTYTVVATLGHNSSGTPLVTFGGMLQLNLETSTTPDTPAAYLLWNWLTATHASREGQGFLGAYDGSTPWEAIRWGAVSGAPQVGFLGAPHAPAQTGDAGDALVTFGLMTGTPTFSVANLTDVDSGQAVITSNFALSSSAGTWDTVTGLSTGSLPAGTYEITCELESVVLISSGSAAWVSFRLYNSTDATAVADTVRRSAFVGGSGISNRQCTPLTATVVLGGTKTIVVQAKRDGSGSPVFTASAVSGVSADGVSSIRWKRIG